MATVIDELVVKLGLDPKAFEKGANIVVVQMYGVKGKAERTSKDLQQAGKKGAAFFSQLQGAAIKFFGAMAVGAGAIRVFTNLIGNTASLSRLSQNLGTSVDSLHRWGKAVQQSGGTVAGFQASIGALSAEITAWKTGQGAGPLIGMLSVLNVGLVDAQGNAKSLEQIFLDVGDAVKQKMPNRADQFNFLRAQGLDEGLANLLLKSRKEAEKLIASQPGFSDKDAKKAQEAQEKYLALQERINDKFRDLALAHLPTIDRIITSIAKSLDVMAPHVDKLVTGFATLNEQTDGWLGMILAALVALRAIGGLGILGAGAAALAGAGAGAAGAAGGGAVAGAAGLAAKAAPAVSLLLGDTLSPVTKKDQETYDLKSRAALGDRDAAMKLSRDYAERMSRWFGLSYSEKEIQDRATKYLGKSAQSMSGKVDGGANNPPAMYPPRGGEEKASTKEIMPHLTDEMRVKIANAEKQHDLPPGLISSIMRQETGGKKDYIDDPAKYHYALNAEGKRIAGHTGKVSTAFGPFGLLESTAKDPGYGVPPLKDKSFDEQLRLISHYVAARAKSAGSLEGGLAGYGEGPKYAKQVIGRIDTDKIQAATSDFAKIMNGAGGGSFVPKSNGHPMTGVNVASQATPPTQSNSVNVGEIKVYTQATDAKGIADSLRNELVMQANYGMR